jgi:hypothetical protein
VFIFPSFTMDQVKRSLKGARRQLSLRVKAVEEAIAVSDVSKVESRVSLLTSAMTALQKLDEEMANLCEDESEEVAEEECIKAFEYQDRASLCLHEAKSWLKVNCERSLKAGSLSVPQVKLEKLSLPSFEGNILGFQSFWDTFESRVHSNSQLNLIDKFDYLVSRCKGPAAEALSAIPRTSAGYELAVSTLKRRFGRRAPVINLRLTELIESKRLSDDCSTAELRKLLDLMNIHVRSLLSLGLSDEGGAEWIGPVLIARLPLRLRLRWEEMNPEEGVCKSLEEFLDFFHKMVEIEEASQGSSCKRNAFVRKESSNTRTSIPKYSRKPNISSSLNTEVSAAVCRNCKASDHSRVWKCPRFLSSTMEERRELCKRLFLCFNCLSQGHSVTSCSSSSRCRKCNGKHHTFLHNDRKGSFETSASPGVVTEITSNATLTHPTPDGKTRVLLQSCQASAHGPEGHSLVVRVLFDSCSSYSFIRKSTADRLKLSEIRTIPLVVNTFGCNVIQRDFSLCSLKLNSLRGGSTQTVELIVTDDLVHPIQGHQLEIERYEHLKSLFLPEDYSSGAPLRVDVIIGANYFHDFVSHRMKRGSQNEPVAVKTVLGWTLHGPYSPTKFIPLEPEINTSLHCELSRPPFADTAGSLDRLWTLESIQVPYETEQDWVEPALKDGRISSALPWKTSERPFSNKPAVQARQSRTDSRLTSDEKYKRDKYFEELQSLDIIEPCSKDPPLHSWYLPHHCIWQNKLRVVFDGSFGQPSLNEMLVTGPNLLNVIPACLTSFRLFSIPITADIEKAFLQIEIDETDRDFLRFIDNNTTFRFCRLPFGLTCSPAILNSSLSLLYSSHQEGYPETVQRLRHCTYVDDVVTSFPDEESLQKFKDESVELFCHANMNLRGWTSSPDKILGLGYRSESDNLVLPVTNHSVFSTNLYTRRGVLSFLSSLFDPLGLWLPWTIRLRALLQTSWTVDLSWDDEFTGDLRERWLRLLYEARLQFEFTHPRCLNFDPSTCCELHVFADASQTAYATCVYLLSSTTVELLYARSRVCPLKPILTTPRAELMAALLSARAIKMLRENVPLLRELPTYFWSDSMCVLGWLRGNIARLKLFVRNRVTEISKVDGEWRHVPSRDNPADLASRGISAATLSGSKLWKNGPIWLRNRSDWPSTPNSDCVELEVVMSECSVKDTCDKVVCTLLPRYNTLQRFVRILGWILRFVNNLDQSRTSCASEFLSYDERVNALHVAVRHVQEEHFAVEFSAVRKGTAVSRSSSLYRLKPAWDTNRSLMVTSPRTNELPKIFLPASSQLTTLVIFDIHVRLAHAGVDRTLAKFQTVFWTCRARLVVKRALRDCKVCKRLKPPSYTQSEGRLPDFRVEFSHPFQYVGLDHAGPLYLRGGSKVYVLLFTCACIRAIHLELVHSLSTEDTALAFRRFQARRGAPRQVFSDNAPCFRRLAPLISAKWSFIPERAPTWGGWWERMIQTVKRSLRKVVGRTSLTSAELFTVLVEVEGAINERPLTYVSDEVNSVSPLTPAHFLRVQQPLGAPWVFPNANALNRSWRYQCKVASELTSRWKLEYLPTLRQWRGRDSAGIEPKVGDVVLVSEGPKGAWPLGRIVALHPGKDGFVRVVSVLIRGRVTRRLTRMLYPLESS